jgi:hypothetical protein
MRANVTTPRSEIRRARRVCGKELIETVPPRLGCPLAERSGARLAIVLA